MTERLFKLSSGDSRVGVGWGWDVLVLRRSSVYWRHGLSPRLKEQKETEVVNLCTAWVL